MTTRPQVLILIGALWPGNEASGPNRSIVSMVEALSDEFAFQIVARDRPFGASGGSVCDRGWIEFGAAEVMYLGVGRGGYAKGLGHVLRETPHDLLLLNSFFDWEFTGRALLLRRIGRAGSGAVLLSPRGEFSRGALELGSAKKQAYRRFMSIAGAMRHVHLHATSAGELSDLRSGFPRTRVTQVEVVRRLGALPNHVARQDGSPLRVAFVGRISPVKGLDRALQAVGLCDRPAVVDVYGPEQDLEYARRCQRIAEDLPGDVMVQMRGVIDNSAVIDELAEHDVLLLPSASENFGHAIFESFTAGTPVVIGNETPWTGLREAKAGFDLPVHDVDAFAGALQRIADLDPAEAAAWRRGARAVAVEYDRQGNSVVEMRHLLRSLIR